MDIKKEIGTRSKEHITTKWQVQLTHMDNTNKKNIIDTGRKNTSTVITAKGTNEKKKD